MYPLLYRLHIIIIFILCFILFSINCYFPFITVPPAKGSGFFIFNMTVLRY